MRLAAAKKRASVEEAVRETQVARERARGGRRGDAARRLRHPRGRGAVAAPSRAATMVASAPASPRPHRRRLRRSLPSLAPSVSPSGAPLASPSSSRGSRGRRGPGDPGSFGPPRGRRSRPPRGASPRPPSGGALPAFDQLASGMVARSGVPGAAVAVVAGDTTMYTRCFGLRELGRPDQVDDDTLFQLGGVSQAYTTTLLAALAGEGELRWDEPVRRVWPGFRLRDRWASREATFRDLTAARSGLPAYAGSELRAFGYGRAESCCGGCATSLRRPASAPPTLRRTRSSTAAAVGAERATGDSVGPAAARVRARPHRRRRHGDRLPELRHGARQGDAAPHGGRVDGPAGPAG